MECGRYVNVITAVSQNQPNQPNRVKAAVSSVYIASALDAQATNPAWPQKTVSQPNELRNTPAEQCVAEQGQADGACLGDELRAHKIVDAQ